MTDKLRKAAQQALEPVPKHCLKEIAAGRTPICARCNMGPCPHNTAALQPVKPAEQEPVAYLDVGASGYLDLGTDLTTEQLASFPPGRHMLGILGTYGVDGYTPAKPAKREPLTDEELRNALRSCPHDTVENLRVRWLYAKDFARAIERAHGITRTTPQPDDTGRDWSLLEATQESLREHMAIIQKDTALLRQALDCLTYTAPRHDCIDAATEYERMSEATIAALRERLGAAGRDEMTLGEYLRGLRLCQNEMSLDKMAEKIGCAKSYLWEVENDKTMPTLVMAAAMAKAYKTSLNQMGRYL